MICPDCSQEIPAGTERKFSKNIFKCAPCMKAYNAAKTARSRAKQRGPDWVPKSLPRHSMLGCTGSEHRCTGCNLFKSIEMFPKNPETPCGYDPRCKQCRHEARRERLGAVAEKPRCSSIEERNIRFKQKTRRSVLHNTYNITEDMYSWLIYLQSSSCFLCKEDETFISNKSNQVVNLSIDHDHRCCQGTKSCGKCIRHLLCTTCNWVVGRVESKPALIHRFADYTDLRPLENYPGEGSW